MIRCRLAIAYVCLVVASAATECARAATWRVEKDGSGDFSTIQAAIDAAAEGDTVIVGPGRYTETTDFQVDCCLVAPTHVGIHRRNLTIRGVDRDMVIIGPDDRTADLGIVIRPEVGTSRIENVTVQNLHEGVRGRAYAHVSGIRVVNCWVGFFAFPDSAAVIEECAFEDCDGIGVFAGAGSRNVSVLRSTFVNCKHAINFFDSHNPYVKGVIAVGGGTGIMCSAGTAARVVSVSISGTRSSGVELTGQASMDIIDSDVESEYAGMASLSGSRLRARRTRFAGGFAAFYLITQREFDLQNNVFEKGDGYVVYARDYPDSANPAVLDFSGNYWGTTNPDSIATLIWDGNDDSSVHAVVEFVPFLANPVAAETQTFGSFKTLFDGGP
jgi:hypothetical protein